MIFVFNTKLVQLKGLSFNPAKLVDHQEVNFLVKGNLKGIIWLQLLDVTSFVSLQQIPLVALPLLNKYHRVFDES